MEYLNVDVLRENLDELISRTQGRTHHLVRGQSHLATRRLIRSLVIAALRSLQERDINYLSDRLVQAALDNIFQRIEFQEIGELGSIVLGVIAEFLEEREEEGDAVLLDSVRPVINSLNSESTRYELQVRFNRITQDYLNRQIKELTLLEKINRLEREAFTEPRQDVWDSLLEEMMEILDTSDGVIYLNASLFTVISTHFHYTNRNPELLDQTAEIFEKLSGQCIDPELMPAIRENYAEESSFNPSLDRDRVQRLIQQYHPGSEEFNAGRPQTNLDVDNPNPLLAFCEVSSYINLLMSQGEIHGLILMVKDEEPFLSDNDYAFLETVKNTLLQHAENIVLHHRLSHMAVTDPLTEIYNRRHFEELMESEVNRAKRYSSPLSMAMVDIDHFKDFNDTYGHMVGDRVLQHVTDLLEDNLRASEVIARYGGEEFAVLMPETDLNSAELVGEKIRRVIEENPFEHGDAPLTLTVSVGVSSLPRFANDGEELINSADQALYMAKEEGRNQVRSYREVEREPEEAPHG